MPASKYSLAQLIAERERRLKRAEQRPGSLYEFLKQAWPYVVPNAPFVGNWHIGAICEHLEAQSRGQLPRLVINIPPGSSKSTTVCVMWPCWEWTWRPGTQWQFASYADTLSTRDSLRCRELMGTPWYRELWGDVWQPKRWLVDWLQNDQGGIRQALSVGGIATGFHSHRQVVDDPTKPTDAHSPVMLEKAEFWWFETMASRVLPGDNTRTIIMQRIHDLDLAGKAAEQGYGVLSIPMVYTARARRAATPIGWEDPRRQDGELLCAARWSQKEVDTRKREFGPDGWAAQDQQDPVPAGGAIYKEEWMHQYYQVVPELYGHLVILSIDCAFKDHESSSYVAAQVWSYKPPNFFLLDEVREHLDFLGTVAAAKTLYKRWPQCSAIIVEDKANGPAVIAMLRKEIPGVVPVTPDGSKVARAYATQPVFASGCIWLPDPLLCPWILDWVLEHKRFPKGKANDRVDAQTQAIRHFLAGGMAEYMSALEQAQL